MIKTILAILSVSFCLPSPARALSPHEILEPYLDRASEVGVTLNLDAEEGHLVLNGLNQKDEQRTATALRKTAEDGLSLLDTLRRIGQGEVVDEDNRTLLEQSLQRICHEQKYPAPFCRAIWNAAVEEAGRIDELRLDYWSDWGYRRATYRCVRYDSSDYVIRLTSELTWYPLLGLYYTSYPKKRIASDMIVALAGVPMEPEPGHRHPYLRSSH